MTENARTNGGRDLVTAGDVLEFVRRFYSAIGPAHPVHPYLDHSGVDLRIHEERLTDFWLGLLGDRPGSDADAVIEAHRSLHDQMPIDQAAFESWLDTLDETLDGGWSGPRVEMVRKRGYGLARAMAKRFCGISLRHPPGYVPTEPRADITDRTDIDQLVERLYRDVSVDELLRGYFVTVANVNWQAHMLTLGDYWHGVLFSRDHDDGELTIENHRHLDAQQPFTAEIFTRWLELFDVALDDWSGPNVERLRRHGHGMAWAMARRYVGVSLPRFSQQERLPQASLLE